MAISPIVSDRRRRASNVSLNSVASSQRHLYASSRSPSRSRPGSVHSIGGNLAEELDGLGEETLDSLEAELDGWDGVDEVEEQLEDENGSREGVPDDLDQELERDSGIDVASSPSSQKNANVTHATLTPPSPTRQSHTRQNSKYDGSEYGSDSDLEESELVSASLEARLASIEAMARRGLEENGSGIDRIIPRFTDGLRDLGAQMGVESGTTRLTTAHTALTTHLAHQSRLLQRQTSRLLSPLSPSPHPDHIDELLPPIEATLICLLDIIPSPQTSQTLRYLTNSTTDLIRSLSFIADTLQVNRQNTTVAGRRLRGVRDVLAEWRRDWNQREEGERYIERGRWDERLARRECAAECRSILSGFEDKCGTWRDRLGGNQVGSG